MKMRLQQQQSEAHSRRMKSMQRAKSYPEELLRDSFTNSLLQGLPRICIHPVHEEVDEENTEESECCDMNGDEEINALDYVKFTLRAAAARHYYQNNRNSRNRLKSCGQLQSALVIMAIRDNDSIQLWRLLSRKDVDVNETDGAGMKPIHYACLFGSLEMLKILIQNEADYDATSKSGDSCLDIAVNEGNFEVAQYLIMKGAKVKNIVNGITSTKPSTTFKEMELEQGSPTTLNGKRENYRNTRRLSKEI